MTDSTEPAPTVAAPRPGPGPTHRVTRRLVLAVVVTAVMLLGIVGLVGAAIWGDDDEPTGLGLAPAVNAEAPAVADASVPVEQPGAVAPPPPADDAPADSAPAGTDAASGTGSEPAGGDDVDPAAPGPTDTADATGAAGPDATAAAAVPVASIEPVDGDIDLPSPGAGPVELPAILPVPVPVPSQPAVALAELDPATVDGLDGFEVVERGDDYLRLTDGNDVIEVFLVGESVDASTALDSFFDDRTDELAGVDRSAFDLLAAPASRWLSVVGTEFSATSAGQQATRVITGSAVAGVDLDGRGVVVTTTRQGSSTEAQRAADGARLAAVLGVVAPG